MRISGLGIFLLLFCLVLIKGAWGQEENYGHINIQGQVLSAGYSEADFEFLVIAIDGDTLWRETHNTISLTEEGAFTVPFGAGTFVSGEVIDFHDVNWLDAERIELYNITGARYLQGGFNIQSVPYSLHSLRVLYTPSVSELTDAPGGEFEVDNILVFDGVGFTLATESVEGDSTLFGWTSDTTYFADTVWFALNDGYADTALFAYYADTSNYALESVGNWNINGNTDLPDTSFIGPTVDDSLMIRTNNSTRLVFTDSSEHNNFPGPGFRFSSNRGILFTPNTNPGLGSVDGSYMYYDGETYSFHGGLNTGEIDTLKGTYSFAWGEDVGTNGTYSTVFGKDTYGDTAIFGGTTPYAAISSFAAGRNCHVTHMGFAVGDSAIAGYYRNIAIGKKVVSTTASAGVAMGNNVLVTGATSWAGGHNLTASGHFSTAMGTNASTDARTGSFVYGDNSTTDTVFNTANHQFMVRAAGGYVFYSSMDLTMGVELLPGAGSWSMISDRSKKTNINPINPIDFTAHYDSLQVYSWNYIGNATPHIGPMAQDMFYIFDAGEKPYYINMIDSDGISLLGIKMLKERTDELPEAEEVEIIESEIETEKEALDDIERRINTLYEELDHN